MWSESTSATCYSGYTGWYVGGAVRSSDNLTGSIFITVGSLKTFLGTSLRFLHQQFVCKLVLYFVPHPTVMKIAICMSFYVLNKCVNE